jgi:tetratricopeptide (TPR) repeat protein
MKTTLICIFLFSSLLAYSQGILNYEEDPSKAAVYTDGDDNSTSGMVEIECSASIPLTFRSETLGGLKPESTINKGETINYKIILNRDPRHFREDELYIANPKYRQLSIPLESVKVKEKKYIRVYDPAMDRKIVIDASCYLSTIEKADIAFETGSYDQAKEYYKLATECEDYKKYQENSTVEKRIQDIDSITVYLKNAEDASSLLEYRRAGEFYSKAFALNQKNKDLEDAKNGAIITLMNYCENCFKTAEDYETEGNTNRAKEFYDKVLQQNCPRIAVIAEERIRSIDGRLRQRYHSFSYEFASNTPLGISSGNYKEFYKWGGYFSFRINPKIFELIRDEEKTIEKAEANVSFGWTIMLYKPVWLFFGPGFTTVSDYELSEPDNYVVEDDSQEETPLPQYTVDDFSLKFRNAVSPEIGLLGKIPIMGKDWITLRYTFQYRYALKKADESYIGKTRHVFGIGICF